MCGISVPVIDEAKRPVSFLKKLILVLLQINFCSLTDLLSYTSCPHFDLLTVQNNHTLSLEIAIVNGTRYSHYCLELSCHVSAFLLLPVSGFTTENSLSLYLQKKKTSLEFAFTYRKHNR